MTAHVAPELIAPHQQRRGPLSRGSLCPKCDLTGPVGEITQRLPGPIRTIKSSVRDSRREQPIYYSCSRGHHWSEIIDR
jgi:hypothetical protein